MDNQRLVFRGKRLKPEETMIQLGLESGNVVHLIASIQAPRNPEEAATNQSTVDSTTPAENPVPEPNPPALDEAEVFGANGQQEIIAGILRTLSRTEGLIQATPA